MLHLLFLSLFILLFVPVLIIIPHFLLKIALILFAAFFALAILMSAFYISGLVDLNYSEGKRQGGICYFGKNKIKVYGLLANISIDYRNIAFIYKTRFLFFNKYHIFFYEGNEILSYLQVNILFRDLTKNISYDKKETINGLFSSFMLNYIRRGVFITNIITFKDFFTNPLVYYFNKTATAPEQEYNKFVTSVYLRDCSYSKEICKELNNKGFLKIKPAKIFLLGFTGFAAGLSEIGRIDDRIFIKFFNRYFILNNNEIKKVIIRGGSSFSIVHTNKELPEGITLCPFDAKAIKEMFKDKLETH